MLCADDGCPRSPTHRPRGQAPRCCDVPAATLNIQRPRIPKRRVFLPLPRCNRSHRRRTSRTLHHTANRRPSIIHRHNAYQRLAQSRTNPSHPPTEPSPIQPSNPFPSPAPTQPAQCQKHDTITSSHMQPPKTHITQSKSCSASAAAAAALSLVLVLVLGMGIGMGVAMEVETEFGVGGLRMGEVRGVP